MHRSLKRLAAGGGTACLAIGLMATTGQRRATPVAAGKVIPGNSPEEITTAHKQGEGR